MSKYAVFTSEFVAEFIGVVAAMVAAPRGFGIAGALADEGVVIAFRAALGVGGFGVDIVFKKAEDRCGSQDSSLNAGMQQRSHLFINGFVFKPRFSSDTTLPHGIVSDSGIRPARSRCVFLKSLFRGHF